MSEAKKTTGSVEKFPDATPGTPVSDELNRIAGLLTNACPADSRITFDFEGRLRAHVDVHKREDVEIVSALLPALGLDLFHSISRGSTPGHPFLHRISAVINR